MPERTKIIITEDQLEKHAALYVRNTDDLAPYFEAIRNFPRNSSLDFFLSGTAYGGRVDRPVYTQGVVFGLSITQEAFGKKSSEITFDPSDYDNEIKLRNAMLKGLLPPTDEWEEIIAYPHPSSLPFSDLLLDLYDCNPLIYNSVKDQMKIFQNDWQRKNFLAGISDTLLMFYRKTKTPSGIGMHPEERPGSDNHYPTSHLSSAVPSSVSFTELMTSPSLVPPHNESYSQALDARNKAEASVWGKIEPPLHTASYNES